MPLYGSAKPVYLYPGQQFVLFDGTETPSAGVKSLAFERAANWSGLPSPMAFTITFPTTPSATVLIEASNDDVEAHYQTLGSSTAILGNYADYGEFRYYRANLSAYASGSMPTVIVQR
jgi:hypothetical protein